ncbi:hypothetical protein Anas_07661 [Armadillidium nasatum]|uniref:DUF7044 domain-containing protein n=1 Tax=Armadillidium nasatum TaxID=96803 RepID=A0A5N5T583_9CRUS|nr:hypothetical protein Anas_07661 [Armadillidium nasatum]
MNKFVNLFCTFNLPKSFILISILNLFPFVRCNAQELVLFPESFQTIWYSREEGHDTQISFSETNVNLWGTPLAHSSYRQDVHDYIFKRPAGCFVCSRFYVRSWNVMERYDCEFKHHV